MAGHKVNDHQSFKSAILTSESLNDRPIIGVISQTLEPEMKGDERFTPYHSYIMESYVDWIEAAGGKVVPLIVGESEDETLDKLSKINGVLMPGGEGNYFDFGWNVYEMVKR